MIRGASWCLTADRLKRTRLRKDVYTIFAWRSRGRDSVSLESMFLKILTAYEVLDKFERLVKLGVVRRNGKGSRGLAAAEPVR